MGIILLTVLASFLWGAPSPGNYVPDMPWGQQEVRVWADTALIPATYQAIKLWKPDLPFTLVLTEDQQEANIVVHFPNGPNELPEENATAGGKTTDDFRGGVIYQADIEISRNDPSAWGPVVCHEMGHALGIQKHSTCRSDLMVADIAPSVVQPSPADHLRMRRIYGGAVLTLRPVSNSPPQ